MNTTMKNLHALWLGVRFPQGKRRIGQNKGETRITLLLLGLLLWSGLEMVAQTTPNSFTLRPGVVVNPGENQLYFANPAGQVRAVDLSNGRTLWERAQPGCPLAQFGEQLICLSGQSGSTNTLVLENLDLNRKGELRGDLKYELPAEIKAPFRNTLGSAFEIRGGNSNGRFFLYYKHISYPRSGIDDPQAEDQEQVQEKGLVLRDGALQEIPLSGLPKQLLGQSILPNANQRIPEKEGVQYLSKNRRHVLVSRRVRDNLDFNCYRWEVYQVEGKKKLGEFLTYRSFAPFYVSQQGVLVYEYGPFSRGPKAEQKTPLSLRAVDLKMWTLPILDQKYRGPFPN